jgi:hypothetical protein
MPRYINPETGTATKEGVAFLETLLMGSALNENTIRVLDNESMGGAKQRIIQSIVEIVQNAALGENSLQANIENGLALLNKAINSKQTVIEAVSQLDMFEVVRYSPEDLAMAILLESKGFKSFLKQYNSDVGTESLFEGKLTKESIIDNLLKQKVQNYEQVRKNLRINEPGGEGQVQQGDGGVAGAVQQNESIWQNLDNALETAGKQGEQMRTDLRNKLGEEKFNMMRKITKDFEKIVDRLEKDNKIKKDCP